MTQRTSRPVGGTATKAPLETPTAAGTPESPATESAKRYAHDAVDSVAESAAQAERKIREFGATAEEQVRDRAQAARAQADDTVERVRRYAEEKPLAAAGIAFAAGLLLSRLLSR